MPACSESLTALLRCPESGLPLHLANVVELEALRADGHPCTEGALIRDDGLLAFLIRDGFPLLVREEAIAMRGAGDPV